MNLSRIADRKALLVTRADLDRTRLALSAREIRSLVTPRVSAARRAQLRPRAAMLLAVAAPFFGMKRLARLVRVASIAMAAIRVARNWRRTPAAL
jgi:hypothetical protein